MEAHSPPASSSCSSSPGLHGGHDGVGGRTGQRENAMLEPRGGEEPRGMASVKGDGVISGAAQGAPESAQHSPPSLRFLLASLGHAVTCLRAC